MEIQQMQLNDQKFNNVLIIENDSAKFYLKSLNYSVQLDKNINSDMTYDLTQPVVEIDFVLIADLNVVKVVVVHIEISTHNDL